MSGRIVRILYKKEILDVIRDKKTIVMMVLLPILLYPVLMLVAMRVVTMIEASREEQVYRVVYDSAAETEVSVLRDYIDDEGNEVDYSFEFTKEADPLAVLTAEEADLYLDAAKKDGQTAFTLHYLGAVTDSQSAADLLERVINDYAMHTAEAQAREMGLDVERVLHPVTASFEDHSSSERTLGSLLGMIVPFMLLATITMASVYPAIDTTAGEKERGTMETLLSMPVNGTEIIMSKFLAVSTLAMVSVFLNILSMGFVAVYLYRYFNLYAGETEGMAAADIDFSLFVPALLLTMLCVLAFAMFVSAVVMCVCSFAGSFKEANNYITPITLVILLTGYLAFIPGIELNLQLALVPVANICLLIKELLTFRMELALVPVVLLSNVVYAWAAVRVLGALYRSDAVLFEVGRVNLHFFERRKNIGKGSIPTVQETLFLLVLILLLMQYVGGLVALKSVPASVVTQQLFFFILPVAAAVYMKGDLKEIFSLRLPKLSEVARGFVLLVATLAVSYGFSYIITSVFSDSTSRLVEMFGTILEGVSFPQAVLLLALLPAICEETFFRGFALCAFSHRARGSVAVLCVAVLFGLMHMSLIRLVPTALLGAVLSYTVLRSRSILTGSILHFANNLFAVILMYHGEGIF